MKANEVSDVLQGANPPVFSEASKVEEYKRNGISIRIRPTIKGGSTRFVLDYRVQGQRKLVWRSTMAKARAATSAAVDKISEGQSEVLNLKAADAYAYTRARAALVGIDKGIDDAVKEYAEAYHLLKGKASVLEACRDWAKRNAISFFARTCVRCLSPLTTVEGAKEGRRAGGILGGHRAWAPLRRRPSEGR